jgi:hypothetical protein
MMVREYDEAQEAASPLEYVIHLGVQGNHVLFENQRIREAFAKAEDEIAVIGRRRGEEVREAVRQILTLPEFESKKEFIATLPPEIQDVLIYLYFQMIEKTIHSNQKLYH